ncbi:hypothetical protein ARMGADRAFT_1013619 [Armillaria gallica]|uniref:Uncharacterized protein n=1 Tax=Armillaria gallica TaxID=47427 RepID=A0A2H3DLU3_ARMGA|nr:hypothetical protein ARMGADRAFT_1013619 [Armillaria gallica]
MSAWLSRACIPLWRLDLIEKHHSVSPRYQQSQRRQPAPQLSTTAPPLLKGIPGTILTEFKPQSVATPRHEDLAVT